MSVEVTFHDLPVVAVDLDGSLHIGIPGEKGEKGEKGDKGDPGTAFVPSVDDNGILSWENDQNLPNPESVDLKPLFEAAAQKELKEIREELADLKYVPIEITGISHNAGTMELGETLTEVTISWSLNKEPVDQSVDGMYVEPAAREATFSGLNITRDTYYTVLVTDERGNTDEAQTMIKFLNAVYYGTLAYGCPIDNDAIRGLLTMKLQSGRGATFTVSPAEGERPVYTCPTRYGTPTFKIGGFEYEWEKVKTFDFTNGAGYTESYDVWMHGQSVTGSITVNVT